MKVTIGNHKTPTILPMEADIPAANKEGKDTIFIGMAGRVDKLLATP